MRAVQTSVGEDNLAVLLISVDLDYGLSPGDATKSVRSAMRNKGVSWPCVLEPSGWKGVGEKFGIDGYHVFLVGPDGKVVDSDLRPDEFSRAVSKALGGHGKIRRAKRSSSTAP